MKQITYLAVAAMLLVACHKADKKKAAISYEPEQTQHSNRKAEVKTGIADSTSRAITYECSSPKERILTPDWDKKMIKNADVTLELKDFTTFNKNIHQNLKSYGAYVAQEELSQNDYNIENNVTIKVPVDKFDDLMNSFVGEGIKVLQRKITTEDVSNEVVDTKGRIETKKQVREQYTQLLRQSKNMKDILDVQNEINGITEEVEAAGSRVQYLTNQAAYSTIHLKYLQYTNGSKPIDDDPSFLVKLKEAFASGGKVIIGLSLLLVNIWPIILLATLGYIFYKRKMQHKTITKEVNKL
jgi:hypothetical protein